MLTEARWQKEQELMRSVFPEFTPFRNSDGFGFDGCLRGEKSGVRYRVVLRAGETTYPQQSPSVFMDPQVGMCWVGIENGRRLCMDRTWRPARSTLANTLLAVLRYLHEFDVDPHQVQPPSRLDDAGRLRADDPEDRRNGGAGPRTRWYFSGICSPP